MSTLTRALGTYDTNVRTQKEIDGLLPRLDRALEKGELLIIELSDEQFRDPARVHRRGLGQAGHAGVGQPV